MPMVILIAVVDQASVYYSQQNRRRHQQQQQQQSAAGNAPTRKLSWKVWTTVWNSPENNIINFISLKYFKESFWQYCQISAFLTI